MREKVTKRVDPIDERIEEEPADVQEGVLFLSAKAILECAILPTCASWQSRKKETNEPVKPARITTMQRRLPLDTRFDTKGQPD